MPTSPCLVAVTGKMGGIRAATPPGAQGGASQHDARVLQPGFDDIPGRVTRNTL